MRTIYIGILYLSIQYFIIITIISLRKTIVVYNSINLIQIIQVFFDYSLFLLFLIIYFLISFTILTTYLNKKTA